MSHPTFHPQPQGFDLQNSSDLDDISARLATLGVGEPGERSEVEDAQRVKKEPNQQGDQAAMRVLKAPASTMLAKKKLLVFDLNGFFVHRIQGPVPPSIGREPDYHVNKFKVYQRPHLDSFLKTVMDKFHLGLVKRLFGEEYNKVLEVVMDRITGIMHPIEVHKPVAIKELSRVWNHPALKGRFDATNILLIDDSPHKAALNPPFTTLSPPSWTADQPQDTSLAPDSVISTFLLGLSQAPDVPSYLQSHDPFPEAAKEPMEVDLTRRIQQRLQRQRKSEEADIVDGMQRVKISSSTTRESGRGGEREREPPAACSASWHEPRGGGRRGRGGPGPQFQTRAAPQAGAEGESAKSSARSRGKVRTSENPRQSKPVGSGDGEEGGTEGGCDMMRPFREGDAGGHRGGRDGGTQDGEGWRNQGGPRKITVCRHWQQTGTCHFGDRCRFSHSKEDLDAPVKEAAQPKVLAGKR